eukprot:1190716-Prorocentrum_minimum.AAC.3
MCRRRRGPTARSPRAHSAQSPAAPAGWGLAAGTLLDWGLAAGTLLGWGLAASPSASLHPRGTRCGPRPRRSSREECSTPQTIEYSCKQ